MLFPGGDMCQNIFDGTFAFNAWLQHLLLCQLCYYRFQGSTLFLDSVKKLILAVLFFHFLYSSPKKWLPSLSQSWAYHISPVHVRTPLPGPTFFDIKPTDGEFLRPRACSWHCPPARR